MTTEQIMERYGVQRTTVLIRMDRCLKLGGKWFEDDVRRMFEPEPQEPVTTDAEDKEALFEYFRQMKF